MIYLLDGTQFDWMHSLEVFFGGLGAFGVFVMGWWTFHREDKRQADQKAEREREALLEAARENERKTDERHKENQKILETVADDLNTLSNVVKYNPPHIHAERNGALTVDGIIYGKNGR
jgi:hypothetical protein